MPATIVPINLTRSFSLKNPPGIRYGNFEGVVHLPPISKDKKLGVQDFSQINNQQIYRTVCDWFEYWRPWQQKTFLYGVVDRCSTRQLDILATTLEPVRHRDYAAAYKMRYPSSNLKTASARIEEHEKKTPNLYVVHETVAEITTDKSSDYTSSFTYEREGSFKPQRMDLAAFKQEAGRRDLFNEISENDSTTNEESSDKNGSIKGRESGIIKDQLAVIEEKVVFTDTTEMSPVRKFADNLAGDVLQKALEEVVILQKYMNKEDNIGTEAAQSQKPEGEEKTLEKDASQDTFRVFHSSKLDRSYIPPPNSASKGLPANMPALTPGLQDVIPRQPSELTRSFSGISKKSASQLRYELYGQRTTLSTPDFFSANGLVREGSMQREIRFGQINRPNRLKDIPIPLQRSFKGVKWWTEQPHEGKMFLRANKNDLISNFKDQLHKIWNWLELWEDYEKINLLKEVLKITNPEVLSALFHYIQQKLRDTRDINRLSDKLLLYIFSFLEPDDITSCSQVCRRWRFLCATDSLWMIKCHELGLEEGISNMEDIILKANTKKMGIDWRLAYEELKRITEMMKWDAKKRAKAAFEEAERLRKLKEAEEEVDIEIASVKSLKFHLKFEDIMTQYQRQYHYDVYTPSTESSEEWERASTAEVDIHVKRGTQSALEREEALKREKEEEKKNQKKKQKLRIGVSSDTEDEDKESDVISTVSSEDFTNEKDFVYQEKEDEESFYRTKSTLKWKRLKSNLSDEKPKELEKIRRDHQAELRALAREQDKERFRLKRSKTDVSNVKSMVKKKPQPKKNKDEIALDVRTDLVQAKDILGKSVPNLQLEWKKQEEEETEERIAIERYMGVVKSVRRVRKLQGHMNGVVAVHFDKKRLISAGLDRTIRLWDIRSGKSIHKFYGHKGGIRCLQFEGNTLLTGSWDTTIMVWDLRTFERKTILADHRDCVSCLKMNHEFIVSGSHDRTIRVWYRLTFMPAKTLTGHKAGINCLDFDGTFVISGASDMTLRLVNINTEECLHVFENGQDQVLSVVLQGDLIISSDMKGHVYFWNKETGNSEAAIEAHDAPVNKMSFYRGRFFTAASDNTVREWDLLTMTSVRVLQGHNGPVRDIKVANDRIVTCSDDGTVRIWDLYDSHIKATKSKRRVIHARR